MLHGWSRDTSNDNVMLEIGSRMSYKIDGMVQALAADIPYLDTVYQYIDATTSGHITLDTLTQLWKSAPVPFTDDEISGVLQSTHHGSVITHAEFTTICIRALLAQCFDAKPSVAVEPPTPAPEQDRLRRKGSRVMNVPSKSTAKT